MTIFRRLLNLPDPSLRQFYDWMKQNLPPEVMEGEGPSQTASESFRRIADRVGFQYLESDSRAETMRRFKEWWSEKALRQEVFSDTQPVEQWPTSALVIALAQEECAAHLMLRGLIPSDNQHGEAMVRIGRLAAELNQRVPARAPGWPN